jgi:hypothetical protein
MPTLGRLSRAKLPAVPDHPARDFRARKSFSPVGVRRDPLSTSAFTSRTLLRRRPLPFPEPAATMPILGRLSRAKLPAAPDHPARDFRARKSLPPGGVRNLLIASALSSLA